MRENKIIEIKRKIISELLQKGIIANKEVLKSLNEINDLRGFYNFFNQQSGTLEPNTESFLRLITNYNIIQQNNEPVIKEEKQLKNEAEEKISQIISKTETNPEKDKEKETFKERDQSEIPGQGTVRIIQSYEEEPKKRDVQDFVKFFKTRFNALSKILQNRKELSSIASIRRLKQRQERGDVAIIGMVKDKQTFKSGTIMLQLEDNTDTIKVMIKNTSKEAYETAKDTVLDEVIGVTGLGTEDVVIAKNIYLPDIPLFKELKKSPDEAYALFMSDFHFGSKVFIIEAFEKFLKWIRAEQGTEEQKAIAKKVKYLFLIGDLVEGVGIYPNQENDLNIQDIYEQYTEFAEFLKKVPQHIKIIICPGNHDAMRIAEPQPPLYKDFAEAVWKLPNVIMVSNPATVNIHSSEGFPGFDVLLYHGFSYVYYSDQVESIRSKGGQQRPDLIMKFLLQRRHLAPTHKSNLYLPDPKRDPLVIEKIPDIFASGHIHRVSAANYRNVTMLNCSCWLETTEYQEKVGLKPQPGRAVLVNLQTRKVKILKFYNDPKEKQEK